MGAPLTDGSHDVLAEDPTRRPAPLDATEIHAELTGEPAHGRPGGLDRSHSRRRRGRLRLEGGLDDNRRRGSRHGLGRRDLRHSGGGRDRRRLGGCRHSGLRGRRSGAGRLEGDKRLPHLDGVPLLDEDTHDAAPGGAGHLDDGLVGLDFQERLARLDDVPGGNEHADDIARGDVFAQIGQLEIGGHGGVAGENGLGEGKESVPAWATGTTTEGMDQALAASIFSASTPSEVIASATTSAPMAPAAASLESTPTAMHSASTSK